MALIIVAAAVPAGDESRDDSSPSPVSTSETPTPAVTAPTAAAQTFTPTPAPVAYEVQSGDTLSAIADEFGTTVAALVEANGIADPTRIEVGQVLLIPPRTEGQLSATPTSAAAATPQCPTAAQERYFSDALPVLNGLAVGFSQLGDSFLDAGENPLLLFDETWRLEVILALALLDVSADSILTWNPPPGTEEIDGLLKDAATDVKSAVDLIPGAIDDFDPTRLERGALFIASAGQKVTRGTPLVTSFCD